MHEKNDNSFHDKASWHAKHTLNPGEVMGLGEALWMSQEIWTVVDQYVYEISTNNLMTSGEIRSVYKTESSQVPDQ